jgi:hypothetical protein
LDSRSRPIVGSSSTRSSGPCSSAAVTSPRMRCPRESWRTPLWPGTRRGRATRHTRRGARHGRPPTPGRWPAAARNCRSTAGPTTAGYADRTRHRYAAPAPAVAAKHSSATPAQPSIMKYASPHRTGPPPHHRATRVPRHPPAHPHPTRRRWSRIPPGGASLG